MPIIPDTKDWTWVLEKPCTECGFDAATFAPADVAARLRDDASRWPAVLARADVRERPDAATWSPLEYAAHVRDTFRVFGERVDLMRTENDPAFPNWDQDRTAVDDDYGSQDPAVVAVELAEAGEALAARLDSVEGAEWERAGRRGDGARFTVASLAVYGVHDAVHHLWDVRG